MVVDYKLHSKMKKFNLYILTILVWFGSSCSDEFLSTDPTGEFLEDNYYQTEDQLFKALIAAYDPMAWTFPNGRWTSNVMLGEIRSDNANAGGDPSDADQPGWQQIDDFTNDALTGESESFWKKGWHGIYRSNLVINNSNVESTLATIYKGEAKFLRAYYHFNLFNIFGPIPISDHVLAASEYTSDVTARKSVSELFQFMETDLLEAIEVLPQAKYSGGSAGRVSKTTAQALLGKIYLYWADIVNDDPAVFNKAAAVLQEVINSGQYMLLEDYNDLFAFGAKNTDESVFEIQYTNLVPADWGGAEFIDGNMITQLCGVRGLCATHPEYIEGWGFMLPTENLYSSYLSDDTYRRDATIISEAELTAASCNVDMSQQNLIDFEGYWQQKYANYSSYSNPNGGDINLQKDPNEPVIRYADVLLMAAEALHRGSGNDAQAQIYIDLVRERAAGPTATSFRNSSQVMADEGWSMLDLIRYERRMELAGEGDRWFDLVRSGRATPSLFDANDPRSGQLDPAKVYLAIPQKDIDNTAGQLTEYPDNSLFN